MSKELYMAAHAELIEEHMARWIDDHPNATGAEARAEEARACDLTADAAYNRMRDNLAGVIDAAKQIFIAERDRRERQLITAGIEPDLAFEIAHDVALKTAEEKVLRVLRQPMRTAP